MTDTIRHKKIVERITQFLEDAKKHVITSAREERHITPAIQQTVRILDSRIRRLQREYLAIHGSMQEMHRAKIELRIDNDKGSLLDIQGTKHRTGTFDCNACYIERNETGGTAKTFSRVCQCGKGLQHAQFTLLSKETKSPIKFEGLTQLEAQELQESKSYALIMCCDFCGNTSIDPLEE